MVALPMPLRFAAVAYDSPASKALASAIAALRNRFGHWAP
jgi:hypothetical protein